MFFSKERLEAVLGELDRTRSYRLFAAFVRMGVVRRWLLEAIPMTEQEFAAALADLDCRQADLLPETIDDIAPHTQKRLRAIFEFVSVQLRKKGARGMLFAILKSAPSPSPSLDWRLALPVPPEREELKKVSPTRLDAYLRCPFTFFLNRKDILGDKRPDDTASALAPWEVGNVVHAALEAWGTSELKESEDAGFLAEFFAAQVDGQLAGRFGDAVPSAVVPQGDDAKRRLAAFAVRQAAHHAAGWRIAAVERKLEMTVGHTLVYGKCDRIDRNGRTGEWLVFDYKCWDRAVRTVRPSLQMPFYCAMIAASDDPLFDGATRENVACRYWVLPKEDASADDAFVPGGAADDRFFGVARETIARIERGVFWPPAPSGAWRRDYADWLSPSPEETVSEAWLADQRRRAAEISASDGGGERDNVL